MKPKEFKLLDKSARKQRIIDTAIRIFQQKGYRQANIEYVAKEGQEGTSLTTCTK